MKRLLLLALVFASCGCCVAVRCRSTPPKPYTATKLMTRCIAYPWVDSPVYAANEYSPYIYGLYPLWIIEWPIQGLIDSGMYFIDKSRRNKYDKKVDAEFNKVQKEYYMWLKQYDPDTYRSLIKKYPQWAVGPEDLKEITNE